MVLDQFLEHLGAGREFGRGQIVRPLELGQELVAKGVLSPDDVKALLFEAATRVDLVGSEQTSQAAHIMVQEDLAPAFLGS